MGDVVDGGISAADWTSAADGVSWRHTPDLNAGATRASSASSRCPTDDALHHQSTDFAAKARGKFDDIVVLGIGGSALGPIALRTALLKPAWNTLTTRGARRTAASPRARQRRSHIRSPSLLDRTRARAHAVRGHVQVGRHGGDDGAVPRRARAAQRARVARREEPSRVRHRPEEGRAARDRQRATAFRRSTFRRRSAGDSAC